MNFVKFVDRHNVEYAPTYGVWKNILYSRLPEAVIREMGYKEFNQTPCPETPCEVNYHWESYYQDEPTKVSELWEQVADAPADICARLRFWFDTEYREANEKLTRFAAMGIEETVVDAIRGKEYHSLMELYEEAEVVRAEINELENEVEG